MSAGCIIPAAELQWRFSRSSGPGGQHVNTADSRVELSWNLTESRALTAAQRDRLVSKLGTKLVAGVVTVSSDEQRSQLRNRETARQKLSELLDRALAPDAPKRRPTKPTRGSIRRNSVAKTRHSETKRLRQRPTSE